MTDNGIIISSRIRLARNIAELPFPARLSDTTANAVVDTAAAALKSAGEDIVLYKLSQMREVDKMLLIEKRLISDDLLKINKSGAAIVTEDKEVSVLINEEDHFRLQSFAPGLALFLAFQRINRIDDIFSAKFKMAYNENLGYLTACPTNLGTGMRASVMMFLPGLTITGFLGGCIADFSRLDITVRGLYGEGSGNDGYLYQVSNQKTLGLSEKEIIESVTVTVEMIVVQEEKARKAIFEQNGVEMRDKIMRAYGILSSSYVMSSSELLEKLSLVKLGVYYNIFECADLSKLDELIIKCMPAHLSFVAKNQLISLQRDIFRAEFVSKEIKEIITF